MIPDDELSQMAADAERMVALRCKQCMKSPWDRDIDRPRLGCIVCDAAVVNYVNSNIASNVLRLVEENRGLSLRLTVMSVAMRAIGSDDRLQCRCGTEDYSDGEQCPRCFAYDTDRMIGVPVPEHLKPYEGEGT